MCTMCGCGSDETTFDGEAPHRHDHVEDLSEQPAQSRARHQLRHTHANHAAGHGHAHDEHDHAVTRTITLERDILDENNIFADRNRRRFAAAGILALNFVSSPGSGKTTLLVRTIGALAGRMPIAVIEGDQQTSVDADRIRAAGAPAVQINTGKGCHLDAHMVGHALEHLPELRFGFLFIENVGNLVCPAAFDLGEAARVAIVSVTEGDDKPLKYPDIFAGAHLILVNKIDLAPHVDADIGVLITNARRVNPDVDVLTVSARTGEGLDAWLDWLDKRRMRRAV